MANHQKSPAGIDAIRRIRSFSLGSLVKNPSISPIAPPTAVNRIKNEVHNNVFRLTKKISAMIGARQTHKMKIVLGGSLSQSLRILIASGMNIMSRRPILNCNTRKSEIVRGHNCLNDSATGNCSNDQFKMQESDNVRVIRAAIKVGRPEDGAR